MNTTQNNTRPFGFWITAIDRLMAERFAAAFENEGITRRDWRLLNVVAEGGDPHTPKIRRLVARGWITRREGGWQLTDAGRDAKQRLGTIVEGIRAQVAEAVSPEEYAVMTASLENIARAFGWEEGKPLPRRNRHGHRGGHRHGHKDHPFGRHGRGPWGSHAPQVQHIHIHTH
jgi:hypothetical protein